MASIRRRSAFKFLAGLIRSVVGLSAIDILYIVFLVGSLAFGLEAMLIGLGGKLMVMYRRRRAATFGASLFAGLSIVAVAVITSMVFKLEPIYFAIIVLIYAFIAGRIIKVFGPKLVGTHPPLMLPKTSEEEMKEILTRRGYGDLMGKSKRRRKAAKQRGV